jgi:LPXTG-site transpeptidase (sortase) family protein
MSGLRRQLQELALAAAILAVIATVLAVTGLLPVPWERIDGSQPAVSIAPAPDANAGLPAAIAAASAEASAASDGGQTGAAQPDSAGVVTPSGAPRPAVAAGRTAQMRIRIPAMGVDASLVDLGFNDAGLLDVPWDGAVVGWYTLSALPGEPGNALLGAHVDWRGSTAVFWRLRDLTAGDMIYIDTAAGELVYRVDSAGVVPNDTPLGEVLDTRSGSQSLTLFTCGGTFDQAEREYDQRVIVRAVFVPASAQALD